MTCSVKLEACKALIASFRPWSILSGPVDIVFDDSGHIACIGRCNMQCEVTLECNGVAAPAFHDALLSVKEGDPLAVAENPSTILPSEEEVFERGFASALVYSTARGRGALKAPSMIVTPSFAVHKSEGEAPPVAAVSISKSVVYNARRSMGCFPVECLDKKGLLRKGILVVGSWIASWEAELVKKQHGNIIVPLVSQAIYGHGAPPRPDLIDMTMLASFGVNIDAWELVRSAYMTYASIYWGRPDPALVLSSAAAAGRIAGFSAKIERGVEAAVQVVKTLRYSTARELILGVRSVKLLVVKSKVVEID